MVIVPPLNPLPVATLVTVPLEPEEPFEAAVTLPFASTVMFAFVYDPAVTPELPKVKTTD